MKFPMMRVSAVALDLNLNNQNSTGLDTKDLHFLADVWLGEWTSLSGHPRESAKPSYCPS
jgi:hypothetical protein